MGTDKFYLSLLGSLNKQALAKGRCRGSITKYLDKSKIIHNVITAEGGGNTNMSVLIWRSGYCWVKIHIYGGKILL